MKCILRSLRDAALSFTGCFFALWFMLFGGIGINLAKLPEDKLKAIFLVCKVFLNYLRLPLSLFNGD